jgi:hypothetical protein
VAEGREQAFEFAQETTKQLITLATGTIALTITFLKDLAQAAPDWSLYLLALGWLGYLVSVVCGVMTLQLLTGAVRDPDATVDAPDLASMAKWQFLAFVLGTTLTVLFGVAAVFKLA